MRVLSALIALLLMMPIFSSSRATAGTEILPPCNPFWAAQPLTPNPLATARASTSSDSSRGNLRPRSRLAQAERRSARVGLPVIGSSGTWQQLVPMGWYGSTMIADPSHARLVVFGGQDNAGWTGDVWMRSLADSGVWRQALPEGAKPASKYDGTAIYEPRRNRMSVFGGLYSDGVWALSLGDAPAWTQLALPGSGPGDREGARAVYDPIGDRLITFGGASPSLQNDVWAFALGDSSGWTRLSPVGTGPTTRSDGVAVYDSRRHRMLLFSGCDWNANYPLPPTVPDLWALSLEGTPAWTSLTATGDVPPGLYFTAAAYDSVHDQMVVYGGTEWAVGPHADAWVLECGDSPAWTRVLPATAPTARANACLTYDAIRDRFVMFGGTGTDTWSLQLRPRPSWTQLESGSDEPLMCGYLASTTYDPVQHASLVIGGFAQFEAEYSWWPVTFPNLWRLDFAQRPGWTRVLPDSVAPADVGESIVVDARTDRAIVFAGMSREDGSYGGLRQISLTNPSAWSDLPAQGDGPLPRDFHSAIDDPVRGRMLVFGGRGPSRAFDDTWELSLGPTPTWTRFDSVAAAPPARFGHNAIYDPIEDRMIVFGGTMGARSFGDLWQLALSDPPAWKPLDAAAGPSPRSLAAMVYDSKRQRLVLIGGRGQDGSALADMWFLPLAEGAVWTRADSSVLPPGPRWGAVATYDPEQDVVILSAGASDPCSYTGLYSDTWVFHPSEPAPATVVTGVLNSNPGAVTLRWSGLPGAGCTATVQRRTSDQPWSKLASLIPDVGGSVDFVDRAAAPGATYDYRLQWFAGSVAGTSADVTVRVAHSHFALVCTNANPSHEGLSVAFSLPDAAPAQIGVYDVAGRELVQRDVGAQGPGDHLMQLLAPSALRPGVYLVRLRHGGSSRVVRASVLR